MVNGLPTQNIVNSRCRAEFITPIPKPKKHIETKSQELFDESTELGGRHQIHLDKGLMVQSDLGSQYCAHDYQKLLQQFGMIAPMSRKGDYYDNAPIESFWGILKAELASSEIQDTATSYCRDYREY